MESDRENVRTAGLTILRCRKVCVWHRAFESVYLPRNSAATSFFAFAWDDTTVAGKKTYVVPNGADVIKVSVLKALGDEANPAHWETFTSPVVTIARP